jgi:hypothetical protein
MTDLQLMLLFLAAAILLAVYLHGRWQEHQAMQLLDARMRGGVGDALAESVQPGGEDPDELAAELASATLARPDHAAPRPGGPLGPVRIEPRLNAARPGTIDPPHPVSLDDDPADPRTPPPAPEPGRSSPAERVARPPLHAPPDRSAAAAASAAAATGGWVEDPLLDFVIELRCAHAVDGVAVIDAAAPLARLATALPAYLVAWDARVQQWVVPDRFGFYSDLLVATQLANRRRILGDIEASQFLAAVQQVSLALDADFDAPEIRAVVQQAGALDRLCAPFDVQLGLTLESSTGPWEARRLDAAARQAGMVPAGELRWEQRDAAGQALFSLSSASLVADRLALELDVPAAPAAADPLRAMLEAAQRLGAALGARIVDDNGRPIDAGSVASIEAQLTRLYADMRAAGMEPGGARARRLFVAGLRPAPAAPAAGPPTVARP